MGVECWLWMEELGPPAHCPVPKAIRSDPIDGVLIHIIVHRVEEIRSRGELGLDVRSGKAADDFAPCVSKNLLRGVVGALAIRAIWIVEEPQVLVVLIWLIDTWLAEAMAVGCTIPLNINESHTDFLVIRHCFTDLPVELAAHEVKFAAKLLCQLCVGFAIIFGIGVPGKCLILQPGSSWLKNSA
jgi:hypothetical protein